MHQFDAAQDHAGSGRRFEPEHRSDPPLDGPMILLDPIIEIGALADKNNAQNQTSTQQLNLNGVLLPPRGDVI